MPPVAHRSQPDSGPIRPPASAPETQAPAPPKGARVAGACATQVQGVTWHAACDAGLLAAHSPEQWADPAGRGWVRVKANALRSVWRGEVSGQICYLKYFASRRLIDRLRLRRGRSACRHEMECGLYALRWGVRHVPMLACTDGLRDGARPLSLLITRAVEPSQPLRAFWSTLAADDVPARRRADAQQLIESVAELLARAHQAGLHHLDLHPDNVLVRTTAPRRYEALFVDLQRTRFDRPISDQDVVIGLAQLNQWFRRHSSIGDRLRFLRAYLRWRDVHEAGMPHGRALELSFRELVTALAGRAVRHAERLGRKRDRRALRNGRYFCTVEVDGWRGIAFASTRHAKPYSRASALILNADDWRRALRGALPDAGAAQGGGGLKASHSAAVDRRVLCFGATRVPAVVKRPLARNWQRALRLALAPSRSRRGWRIGNALLHRDIPTARPLACLERRWGPLVRDSVLITEALPGALDLESYLRQQRAALSPRAWAALKRALAEQAAGRLRQLHERGFAHRDCKAANLLVVGAPVLDLVWIDLDGIRQVRRTSLRREVRALSRLYVSAAGIDGITRTDAARFLRAYVRRPAGRATGWRELFRRVQAHVERGRRARDERRSWKQRHYGRT